MVTYKIPNAQHYFPGFDGKRGMSGSARNDHFQTDIIKAPLTQESCSRREFIINFAC